MGIRRVFLIAGLAGAGLFFTLASASPAAPESGARKAQVAAAAQAPLAWISGDRALPAPVPGGNWGSGVAAPMPAAPAPARGTRAAESSALIDTEIQDKYRSFRDSLTAP